MSFFSKFFYFSLQWVNSSSSLSIFKKNKGEKREKKRKKNKRTDDIQAIAAHESDFQC
jgi:hypothetical protein